MCWSGFEQGEAFGLVARALGTSTGLIASPAHWALPPA